MGLFNWLFQSKAPDPQPPSPEEILALLVKYERKAIAFDPVPLTVDPFAHKLCTVGVALPTETWPEWDGKPMVGMLQINLTRLEWVPEVLKEYALIAFYSTNFFEFDSQFPEQSTQNGNGWLVRTYPQLETLVPILNPYSPHKGFGQPHDLMPNSVFHEQPTWEDIPEKDQTIWSALWQTKGVDMTRLSEYRHEEKAKIGGWPTLMQAAYTEPFPDYTHAFQVCSDNAIGLNIVDGGAFYLSRNPNAAPPNEWLFEIQFG